MNHVHCGKVKGIVHFESNFLCVLSSLKSIQDVGVFVSAVVSILIFLGHIMEVYGHHLKEHAQRSPDHESGLQMSGLSITSINVYLHLRVIKSCLIWTSLCMLFEVVTIDLHYMTDGPKNIKIETTAETKTPTSWMPFNGISFDVMFW